MIIGILIGIIISLLILCGEIYLFQQKGGIIRNIQNKVESINTPKGFILEAPTDKQESISKIIKNNDDLGIETPFDDIIN